MRLALLLLTALTAACASEDDVCAYGDATFDVGESFPADDGCNTCTCERVDGVASVSCTEMGCL